MRPIAWIVWKLAGLVGILIVVFLTIRLIEHPNVFHPEKQWAIDIGMVENAQQIWFESQDGHRLSGVWLKADNPSGVLVYAHGNAGNLSHRIPQAEIWRRELALSILLFDYRGYGRSEGSPSEEGIFLDTLAAFREAETLGDGSKPLLLGRSLGAVPAIRVAAQAGGRGLVLDSPFASLAAMVRSLVPVPGLGRLLSMKMDNLAHITQVTCPVFVIHGSLDRVVPFTQGRQVFAAARTRKVFFELTGLGHNDPRDQPELLDGLRAFIVSLSDSESG